MLELEEYIQICEIKITVGNTWNTEKFFGVISGKKHKYAYTFYIEIINIKNSMLYLEH